MVHTLDTNIILHLVGALCDTTFSGWVVSGTRTDSVLSTQFVIPSVHNQELFQCFMHLLDTILHQPSEVRAKYQLGKPSRHIRSTYRDINIHSLSSL